MWDCPKNRAEDKKKRFSAGLKKSKQRELQLYRKKVKSPTSNNISKYNTYWSVYERCVKAAEQQYFKDIINSKKNKMLLCFGKCLGQSSIQAKAKQEATLAS